MGDWRVPFPRQALGSAAVGSSWGLCRAGRLASLQARWLFGGLTSALAAALLAVSSIGVYQAIQRTRFDQLRSRFFIGHSRYIAAFCPDPRHGSNRGNGRHDLGVFAWGLAANLNATSAFHAYSGPMHSTAFASWMGSICVFAAASVIALRTAPSLLTPAGE